MSPPRGSRVIVVDDNWAKARAQLTAGAARGLGQAAEIVAQATRAAAPVGDGRRGAVPGHMRDTIKAGRVTRALGAFRAALSSTAPMLRASVFSSDPTAHWQDQGTLGRRRRKLSASTLRRRQSGSGQARLARVAGSQGVRAKRFFSKALRSSKGPAVAAIARSMRGGLRL